MSAIFNFFNEYGLKGPHFIALYVALGVGILGYFAWELFLESAIFLITYWYGWIPLALIYFGFRLWLRHNEVVFQAKQEHILLEIVPPKEVTETPKAMELFFNSLSFATGEASFYQYYVNGKRRPQWSFELVSDGGQVHFYIRGRKNLKDIVVNTLGTHYPGVQIYEVPDYTAQVEFDLNKIDIGGYEYRLRKPDPYPLKTYIDVAQDKAEVSEESADPFNHVMDFLGRVPKGHKIWIQIIARAHTDEKKRKGEHGTGDQLKEEAEYYAKKILGREIERVLPDGSTKTEVVYDPNLLTKKEQHLLNALQRSVTKKAFDCGMRGIYISPKGETVSNVWISMLTLFNVYNDEHFNSLRSTRFSMKYTHPWDDIGSFFENRDMKKVFNYYRGRNYFHPPYIQNHFVLTSEELATIFHLPRGKNAPKLRRATAHKGTPPTNLPV